MNEVRDDRLAEGAALRSKFLGEEWAATAVVSEGDPVRDLVDATIEHVWAAYWTRPGLDLKSRSLCTITLMIALGRKEELALHLRGALRAVARTSTHCQQGYDHYRESCANSVHRGGRRVSGHAWRNSGD